VPVTLRMPWAAMRSSSIGGRSAGVGDVGGFRGSNGCPGSAFGDADDSGLDSRTSSLAPGAGDRCGGVASSGSSPCLGGCMFAWMASTLPEVCGLAVDGASAPQPAVTRIITMQAAQRLRPAVVGHIALTRRREAAKERLLSLRAFVPSRDFSSPVDFDFKRDTVKVLASLTHIRY
jgi:hypothetical protein